MHPQRVQTASARKVRVHGLAAVHGFRRNERVTVLTLVASTPEDSVDT